MRKRSRNIYGISIGIGAREYVYMRYGVEYEYTRLL